MSYVYIQPEHSPPLFTVGFYRPDDVWEPESDHPTSEEAVARVHYLNGGPQLATETVLATGDLVSAAKGILYHVDEGCPSYELEARLDRLRGTLVRMGRIK